ncbi:YqzL family protein [Oceanobacillus sp. FSL W8-0428]|uniref:YqzL family protein n=1 Tax=Oceanobacillus sp. FSL W8-0428 TaxID=2921715 RepID=UPI0030F77850
MLDATWYLFCQTGNIETYLLLKELEQQGELNPEVKQKEQTRSSMAGSLDSPSV